MFYPTRYLFVLTLLLVAAGAHRLTAQTGTLSVLYALTSTSGTNPDGALVTDKLGNLYGPTFLGGASNQGTIYQLIKTSTTGGAWTSKVLHSFAGGSDGA